MSLNDNLAHKSTNIDVFSKAKATYICPVEHKKIQIMKTTIKNSLVVIAMLGAITGYANLKPVDALNEDIKKTIINLNNVKEGQRLLIKSTTGTILYRESIQKTGLYKKAFDLTALPNGAYFFELEKDTEITIIPFIVKASEVIFNKEEKVSIFKPIFRVKENMLFVNKLSLDMKPMKIEIFYDSGDFELIHSEEISNTQKIERVYNLLKHVKGNYKIVCKTEGRVFVNYFKV